MVVGGILERQSRNAHHRHCKLRRDRGANSANTICSSRASAKLAVAPSSHKATWDCSVDTAHCSDGRSCSWRRKQPLRQDQKCRSGRRDEAARSYQQPNTRDLSTEPEALGWPHRREFDPADYCFCCHCPRRTKYPTFFPQAHSRSAPHCKPRPTIYPVRARSGSFDSCL